MGLRIHLENILVISVLNASALETFSTNWFKLKVLGDTNNKSIT